MSFFYFDFCLAVIAAGDYIIDQACKLPNLGEVQRFAQTILDYIDDGNGRQGDKYDLQDLTGDLTIDGIEAANQSFSTVSFGTAQLKIDVLTQHLQSCARDSVSSNVRSVCSSVHQSFLQSHFAFSGFPWTSPCPMTNAAYEVLSPPNRK